MMVLPMPSAPVVMVVSTVDTGLLFILMFVPLSGSCVVVEILSFEFDDRGGVGGTKSTYMPSDLVDNNADDVLKFKGTNEGSIHDGSREEMCEITYIRVEQSLSAYSSVISL